MASLKVVSDRCDDNSIKFCVVVPPRRNGEVNFSAAEAVNRALLSINPGAFDPEPPPTAVEQAHRDGHTADGGGIVPEGVARALLRDVEQEDDTGEPYTDPRMAGATCNIGGRCE